MPRTPRIRWTDAQVKRLDSAVRRYNAALSYARRSRPQDAEYLPSTMSAKNLRSTIQSNRELNRIVNSLNRGGTASAFQLVQNRRGEIMPKWQMREAQIAFSVQERRKSVERKRRGIETDAGIKTGNMGTIVEYNLKPATITPAEMSADQIERLLNRAREATRENVYDKAASFYEHYMDAMATSGMTTRFPKASGEVNAIITEIMAEDPAYLRQAYESFNEALRIDLVYDDNMYMTVRMTVIRKAWREIYNAWLSSRTV